MDADSTLDIKNVRMLFSCLAEVRNVYSGISKVVRKYLRAIARSFYEIWLSRRLDADSTSDIKNVRMIISCLAEVGKLFFRIVKVPGEYLRAIARS